MSYCWTTTRYNEFHWHVEGGQIGAVASLPITPRFSETPCEECGGRLRIVGGVSGDFTGARGLEGVDVTDYECSGCHAQFSE